MVARNPRRRVTAAVIVGVLVAAACSPEPDVSTDSAVPIERDPSESEADEGDVTESEAVGVDGLPSLATLDPSTLSGTLDNGLRYLIRDNDNPGAKAELRLAVDAGSVLENDSQVGGAHFLEHMLFNGTERFPENELIDELRSFGAAFGADVNARTGYDETVYMLTVPHDDDVVETGLDILEDWLSFATIDSADVDAERGIVLDEWRARSQTSEGRIAEQFSEFLLEGTPYEGRSPIGGRDAIESITADELRRFYDDWYRPDLASVIVVGDIDPAEVEDWIVERFDDAVSRGSDPERPEISVEPGTATRVQVVDDPELAEGSLSVTLPLAREATDSVESDAQRRILDDLAFDVIATRLDNDALRGDAPFERAGVASATIVRDLDAPGVRVDTDGRAAAESIQAIADEFERVARFGITQAELDRAVAARRRETDRLLDGEGSRQDASYAAEYVRHVLEGEWYVTARDEFDFVTAVLDSATPESVADVFVDRYGRTGAEVFVTVPSDEVDDVGSADELTQIVDSADERELDARPDDVGIGDELVARPNPVEEIDRYRLASFPTPVIGPVVVEFDNGVSASFNTTQIVEGQVFLQGRSPGGLGAVDPADIADAQAVRDVLTDSGLGPFDRVELDTYLDDRDVAFEASVDPFLDSMAGSVATDDLETLMQFVHLTMTDPQADQRAVERYVDDQLPFAEDPSIDPAYAEIDALLGARYGDDERFLLPTPEALATVDPAGVERVAGERFGDASDWSFAFSGDFDLESAIELARSYLGTLPVGDAEDVLDFSEPPPPDGAVVVEATAGQGESANVSFLFTASATADRRDAVLSAVVRDVVGNRLTDVIREELGDSYSPFASIDLGGGPTPVVETYITVSTAPDLVDEVSGSVLSQLDALRTDGPSEQEFDNSLATVGEQLNFVSNEQINDEVLDVLVDAEGSASLDEFLDQASLVGDITRDDVREAIAAWIPESDRIEVRVVPSS